MPINCGPSLCNDHAQFSVLISRFSTRSHIKSVAKRLEKRMLSICLIHATMTETEETGDREREREESLLI